MFCGLLDDLPEKCVVQCAWITGHAGFPGNEVSDYFSKWAANGLTWHRYLTPPLIGSVTLNKRPVLPPPSSAYVMALLPSHGHSDLHLSLSVDYYKDSSFFSSFSFKWSFGNFCMASFEPHWNLSQFICPLWSAPHPLDPITFVAECSTMDSFHHEMFQAWPSPFNIITAAWWESQDLQTVDILSELLSQKT